MLLIVGVVFAVLFPRLAFFIAWVTACANGFPFLGSFLFMILGATYINPPSNTSRKHTRRSNRGTVRT